MTSGLHDAQTPREVDADTGLTVGPLLDDASPAPRPERVTLEGRYCVLQPLDPARHGDQLFTASTPTDAARRFRYLPDPPPESRESFDDWMRRAAASDDPLMFVVIDRATSRVEGRQTLMRITPAHRCIEIGNIYWGPAIAGTRIATEANFLFAQYVFEALGYRRYEWKCDSLNAPSRRAAERFGFTYEGHFRRAVIIKNRNRDTAWYSMIDDEWPALSVAYERWLDPSNFDENGTQASRLSALTAQALNESRR